MFWSARTYSKYSIKTAIGSVADYVQRAAELNHPALAITDRNMMVGAFDLYRQAHTHNINPIPGIDLWVTADGTPPSRLQGTLTLLATNTPGFRNLTRLTHIAFRDNIHGYVDLADLAGAAESGLLDGVACLTGSTNRGLIHALLQNGDNPHTVKNLLTSLNQWFGSGVWVDVPVSLHARERQDELHSLTRGLASTLGLPVIATSEPRYVHPHDRQPWEMLNKINEGTSLHVDPSTVSHLPDTAEIASALDPTIWRDCLEGLSRLNQMCDVTIPEIDTFTTSVPDVSDPIDPDRDLMDRAYNGLLEKMEAKKLDPSMTERQYWTRIDEELEVIFTSGFSGYLLFTATVTNWMRKENILYRVRGSASASLLCWVLNITSIDPLTWKLRFDRFLSHDRAKPPDIDIDVAPVRREDITQWLADTFPTARICTWSSGRTAEVEHQDMTGSLVVQYRAAMNRLTGDPKVTLSDEEEHRLAALADYEPFMSVGVNAAGIFVAPDEATMNKVPLFRVDSSNTLVTGIDKRNVEALGYVKLDVLGVKTLDALHLIMSTLNMTLDDIPPNDPDVIKFLSSGHTGGVFQLDGKTFQRGIKRLKPRTFSDLVDAMALFRPATMQSGETDRYINRKFRKETTPTRHHIINNHVADTYGVLLYQEQAIGVLRDIGLTSQEIEQARDAIKASNNAVKGARSSLSVILDKAAQLGKEAGMSVEDLAWLDGALRAYAEYGFNKAHAVSYAEVAYVSAWCKYHFPLEFWSAFLTIYTGAANEKKYLTEMRDAGIVIRGPHVNKSGANYRIDKDGQSIRKSLTSIKGVGHEAASIIAHNAPYQYLDDLADRLPARKVTGINQLAKKHTPASCGGAIAALQAAGALDELTWKDKT